ncbi:MAG: ATP-binding cassette domain-containing protein [Micrococcales bacterium]|nr:ATP-binding cassette domain-containing protein [Micrococcales bacterium]
MLRLEGINKSFGARQVLKGVTFEVDDGRITGFVGGNGAGKTTTMRIVLGLLKANSGSVTWDGAPITNDMARRAGYMPEERGLYPRMTVLDQLVYLARLHGLTQDKARSNAWDLLERLELKARAKDKVETLSLGNQQRAQVAAALVHSPDLLILDEPFSGLDPLAVDAVTVVLREFAARGVPILFSSHQLDLVERVTDDLVIIAGGEIKATGSREKLQQAHTGERHFLQAQGDLSWVERQAGIGQAMSEKGKVTFDASDADAQQVLRQALDRGPVDGFGRRRPTLAEVFREVIRDEEPGEEAHAGQGVAA